ncbi:hypothetical protein LSAT2_028395, partial [Lamellibrachia satsuma]
MALRFFVLLFVLDSTVRAQHNEWATSKQWYIRPKYGTAETPNTTPTTGGSQYVTEVRPTQALHHRSSLKMKANTSSREYVLIDTTSSQEAAELEDTSHDEHNATKGTTPGIELVSYAGNDSVSATTKNNSYSNQTTDETAFEVEMWLNVLVKFQLVFSVVGFIVNKITLITLVRNGDTFSAAICLLLKHQALVDSWVCAMGAILLLQPPMWTTGNKYFDAAVCYLWHGQAPFWGAILLSVWTLAALAVDRYMAVCRPLKYSHVQGKLAFYCIAVMHVVNVVLMLPSFVEVRFENGVCLGEFLIQGPLGKKLYFAYCLVWFIAVYLLPVTAYVYLYGSVICALYRRKNSTDINCSNVIDAAQSTVTKTAITLTGIFLFAIGFDAWAYVLGYTGVVEYEFGSAKQK